MSIGTETRCDQNEARPGVARYTRESSARFSGAARIESAVVPLGCECDDPVCEATIPMLPHAYTAIRRARLRLVAAGHEGSGTVRGGSVTFSVVQARIRT